MSKLILSVSKQNNHLTFNYHFLNLTRLKRSEFFHTRENAYKLLGKSWWNWGSNWMWNWIENCKIDSETWTLLWCDVGHYSWEYEPFFISKNMVVEIWVLNRCLFRNKCHKFREFGKKFNEGYFSVAITIHCSEHRLFRIQPINIMDNKSIFLLYDILNITYTVYGIL